MKLPLEGIRVVNLGQGAVIPELCRVMGEFGADVINVESEVYPDFMRRGGRTPEGTPDLNNSAGYNEANRGQRSFAVNLRSEEGPDIVRRLIETADVVAENNRAYVTKSWGLDYEGVREFKPDIVYVSANGFGRGGPSEDFAAFGPNLAPHFGLTYLWGHPDDEFPIGAGINHPDHIAGKQGLMAVLAALDHRRRTGQGQYIDMSQAEAGASMMGELYLQYMMNGHDPEPQGNRVTYAAPHGAYRCQGEDRWCVIAVLSDDQWRSFCDTIGRADWAADPRFASLQGRLAGQDELDLGVGEWTAQRGAEEVMETLQAAGVPAGYVQNARDHLADPHLQERGGYIELDHPVAGPRWYPGNPIRLSENPPIVSRSSVLGEHTTEICRDLLGMPQSEIDSLMSTKAIGF